jgi:WD40 repeat protein
MGSILPPLPLGDLAVFVRRIYGGTPLRGEGDLLGLVFDANGLLWSLEEPGILRLWDLDATRQIQHIALEELATLWQFDQRGRFLAGASDEVILWDLQTGAEAGRFEHPIWVTALAFHPSGALLATGHDDGVVRLWDIASSKVLREMGQEGTPTSAVAFDATGSRLAAAYEDKIIRLWDVGTGTSFGSLEGHTDRIPSLLWHPDGRRLLSAGWDTTARVWDTTTLEPIILLNAHQGQLPTFALSPDGNLLACADAANAVHLWHLGNGYRELGVLRDQCAAEIHAMAFSPNGRRLVFAGVERVLNQWDVTRPQQEANQLGDPHLNRTAVALRDQGRQVVSLGMGTGVRMWNATTAAAVPHWKETAPLRTMAVSPCGRYVVGSLAPEDAPNDPKKGTPLVLWDAEAGTEIARAEEQGQPITTLTFAPTGERFASASYQSSNIWLWKLKKDGGQVTDLEVDLLINNAVEGFAVQGVAFHPAGELLAIAGIDYLATSGQDGQVEIYDPRLKQTLHVLKGGASALAFSPDGRAVVLATLGPKVRVVDWASGVVLHELEGPTEPINVVLFSPDGTLLAVGSDDHTLYLYDAATYRARAALEIDEQVKALTFSPDSKLLYTGNGNGTVYQLEVEELLTEAAVELTA